MYKCICLVLVAILTPVLGFGDSLKVIYPRDSGRDKENSYDYQLLRLALEKSGVAFDLSLSAYEMNETRARVMIADNQSEVTVMSAGTRIEFENALNAVFIPLYGGLIGHRIFIIHKDNIDKFAQVKSLGDLQKFNAGQGSDWPDLDVFKQVALPVYVEEYPVLFRLVEFKRVDYFPRGANEPFVELERFNSEYPSLVVEPNLLLVYPFALYFFVSNENQSLHNAISNGLQKAHEDGSFLEFFRTHPVTKKMLEMAKLENRIRFDLKNPTMSERTLSIPDEYWFNLSWLP